jgi:hypothetical protein
MLKSMPAAKTLPRKSRPKSRPSSASKKGSSKSECPHCKGGAESFRYFKGAYKFDVDLARKIAGDGRKAIELTPDDVKYSVDISRIYPEHLEHVDTKYPGIIAHVWGPGRDGEWLHGHLLIDGHHRAARCVQLGIPYFVHILTKAESERVVIHGPISRGRTKPKADPAEEKSAAKKRR